MIDTGRCGTTIVDLGSGAPFGVLGPDAPTAGLRFLEPDGPDGGHEPGDVVAVVAAGRPADVQRIDQRFLAIAVASVSDLALLAPVDPDFVVLLPEAGRGDGGLQAEAEAAAVAAYARARGVEVVALGVADQQRHDELRGLGVRYGAGPHVEARLAGGQSLASSMVPHERRRWLRTRLDALACAADVAAAACEHVAELGLLPSVYVERHGLMRCIAQRGYWQVMDGIPVDTGVLGRTFRLGRTQHVDVAADGEFIEAVPGLVAELAVPLTIDGRVRSVFSVESTRPFTAAEVHEVERVAVELQRALQRTGVDDADGALHALVRAGAELSTLTDEQSVAHAAVRLACAVAGTSSAMVAIPRPGGGELVQAAAGPLAPALRRLDPSDLRALARDLGNISSCMAGGDEDGRVHPVFLDVRRSGGTSLSVFPIRCATAEPGLLFAVDQVPGGLGADHREATELLAGTVARTLDHVRVHATLRYRAERDPLTAVGNRGAFDDALGALDDPVRRSDRIAVLVVDIDRFKQVNDRFGHVTGDQVLVDVARAMLDCLRPDDRLFRIGGDEFAILVPGIDLPTAEDLVRRLVQRTRPCLEAVDAGLSVGAAVRGAGERIAECVVRADEALYEAKADGALGPRFTSGADLPM